MPRAEPIYGYDLATRPPTDFDREVLQNDSLAKIWSAQADEIIKANIARLHWHWLGEGPAEIADSIGTSVLEKWRETEPLCQRYAWYNVLLTYAGARARLNGWTERIRVPEERVCPLCEAVFREDTLRWTTARRLSMGQLDFCEGCCDATLIRREHEPGPTRSFDEERKRAALDWVGKLAEVIERVPHKEFGFGLTDMHGLSTKKRLSVFKLLRSRDDEQLRRLQGQGRSWFDVLVESGVLPEGSRTTSRGIQCRAQDGHMCLSLGEKTLDDLLFRWGIQHDREPAYPGDTHMRGDFLVGDVFIEYFGLAGDAEYDAKTRMKKRMLKASGIPLIAITPKDLANGRYLTKLRKGLEKAGHSVPNDG